MKHVLTVISFFVLQTISAQQYSAYINYSWDQWRTTQWGYIYNDGWCYAVEGEQILFWEPVRPIGNARNFYFRFKYRDLELHELTRKEWRPIKKAGGWIEKYCEFEYYITDQYPTLKKALEAHSWPCAKYYVDSRKPYILKRERVRAKIHFTDDDEVRTINFFFDGCGFAITVHWDYSGYNMTYRY
jgi:hypothetical protein